MPAPSIVGLVMVRDEDVHIGRALENIRAFCTRIVILDTGSRDETPQIAKSFADRNPHAEFHPIPGPSTSHSYIEPFAGSDTWIFAVDGDEIYDPAGLERLKGRIGAGEFSGYWSLMGGSLHCDEINAGKRTACGFQSPPCRSVTKLYNFAAIDSWTGATDERLHGGSIRFRPGFDSKKRWRSHQEQPWEHLDFRCLHACFVARSSLSQDAAPRQNIMESRLRVRFMKRLRRLLGLKSEADWKSERYHRGERVCVTADSFFAA